MKLRDKILVSLAVVGLAVSPLVAQRTGWMGGLGTGHFWNDPERMLAHVSAVLDLTDAQKQFAKALLADTKAQAQPLIAQLKQGHQAMEAAVKGNRSDTEIGDLASQQGVVIGQLAGIHAKAMAKFYAQLTSEQKAKADSVHDRIRSRFMGRFDRAQ